MTFYNRVIFISTAKKKKKKIVTGKKIIDEGVLISAV